MSLCCLPCWANLFLRRPPRLVVCLLRLWWDVRLGRVTLQHTDAAVRLELYRSMPALAHPAPCYCAGDSGI